MQLMLSGLPTLKTCLPDYETVMAMDWQRVRSKSPKVKVIVVRVPLIGIIDTGAGITIIGGSAFKQVAAVTLSGI